MQVQVACVREQTLEKSSTVRSIVSYCLLRQIEFLGARAGTGARFCARRSRIARGRCLGYWQKCQMEDRSERLARSPLQLTTMRSVSVMAEISFSSSALLPLSFKTNDGSLLSQAYPDPTG